MSVILLGIFVLLALGRTALGWFGGLLIVGLGIGLAAKRG